MIFCEIRNSEETLTGCLFHGEGSVIHPVLLLITPKTIMWILDLSTVCLQQVTEVSYPPFVPLFSFSDLSHPLSSTATQPPSSALSYCHQQSEAVIRAVRSGCSLRNGLGKLPYMAMALVALATSCPWEKGTFGGLGGRGTDSPSQNS